MRYRQALNPLRDFGEILCRWAWIRRCVLLSKIEPYRYSNVTLSSSKSQKFRIFEKNLPLRDESPWAIFFTKLGVGEGVPGPPPRAKFHHRGLRNVGLSP